jgi:TolB-like protein
LTNIKSFKVLENIIKNLQNQIYHTSDTMKIKKILSSLILFCQFCFSQQIKIAIVDFDNTSGIAKYDGLGKAMSSMLISDIEANVSPKRLQLVERSQINKILKEQNFQKTSSVDKASTVKMGKLLGVKYLLVGDIFVLNDALVINSRLVDTETGDIKFTEKKEGKLNQWLLLKTALAKGLSTSISMPFTEPNIPDTELKIATVTTFGNAIIAKDEGNIEKAEELVSTIKDFNPDFKYADELKKEIDELKKRVNILENSLNTLQSAFENSKNIYFDSPKTELQYLSNAVLDKRNGRYEKAIENYLGYFKFDSDFIDPYIDFIEIINLPQFNKEFISFENSLNVNIKNKIIKTLCINNSEERNFEFVKLYNVYSNDDLVKFFYFKNVINYDKLNLAAAKTRCERILLYTKINNELKRISTDARFLNYFIDKVKIKNELGEMIQFSLSWSNLIETMIKSLESQGVGIGQITITIKQMFNCSDEDIKKSIINYYGIKDTDINKIKLSGKYYRYYNNSIVKSEYIDFKSIDKIDWISISANLHTEMSYVIINRKIVAKSNGIVTDFEIVSQNEIKLSSGGVNYFYKKE